MNRQLPFAHLISSWLAIAIATVALAGVETKPSTAPVAISPVVYPFEALLAGKRGKVEADFTVDRQGRLLSVTILKSDAPEFSEAVRAHAEATDFSFHAGVVGKMTQHRNEEIHTLHQNFEFEDRPRGKSLLSITTPTPAALEVLKMLRNDPATKEYGGANNLDTPLQVVSHNKPVFPRQLQETHKEGSATVEFYVGKDGGVLLPRAISATAPAFGYSACQSVASWRFTAPVRNGKPVVVRVRIPVNYSLNSTPEK